MDAEIWRLLAQVHGRRFRVRDAGPLLGCSVCTDRTRGKGDVVLHLIDGEYLPF